MYSPLTLRALGAGAAALVNRLRFSVGSSADPRSAVIAMLRSHFRARAVLLTDCGTSALRLALWCAVPEKSHAPVALPAYGCYDIATAAVGAGVPVVLYDIDPGTLAPDLASVEAALGGGACAVVVAHQYGIPLDCGPITELAARAGAVVIEDAAQGVGATLRGEPLGTAGFLSVLSFGRGKGVTSGRGGALLAVSAAGAQALARCERAVEAPRAGGQELAQLFAQWLLGRPGLYAIPAALPVLRLGETVYRNPHEPKSLSTVAARVLPVTWALGLAEADRRRFVARRFIDLMRTSRLRTVDAPADSVPSYLRFPVVVPVNERIDRISLRRGVARAYPTSLADLHPLQALRVRQSQQFPGATTLAARLWTLPTHSRLSEGDLRALGAWIEAGSVD